MRTLSQISKEETESIYSGVLKIVDNRELDKTRLFLQSKPLTFDKVKWLIVYRNFYEKDEN